MPDRGGGSAGAGPSLQALGRRWTWGPHLLGVLLVLFGVLALTSLYVSVEHTLYTWDFHEYSTRLQTTYSELTRSPLRALAEVYLSTSQEYNLIPTIPLLPLRKILGASRMAYELNLAAVFIVPFVLAVGWIGSRTIAGRRGPVFWTTVLIALVTPYTWTAIFRGFVDLGAATLVVMAIALYIADPRLTRQWRPLAIGFLLAAAVVFRRPFVYDGLAFGAAVELIIVGRAALSARAGARSALRVLVGEVLRSGLIVVGGLVTMAAIGQRLLGRVLVQDYGSLYQSYVLDAGTVLGSIGSGFGWLVIVLAIAGFLAAWRRAMLGVRLLFVALYGAVLTVLWAFVVGQEGPHYAVHFVLPVTIGLSALLWAIWRPYPARVARPATAAVAVLLLVNLAAGLTNILPGTGAVARTLIATANPPLIRGDYDEVIRLVRDLRRIAGTDRAVLVIGATNGFSDDTISVADAVVRGDAAPLFVLNSPHVDSRDEYPLAVVLAAQVVALPDPLPLSLPPDRVGVERVMHDLFARPSLAADAFRQLPESYVLEDATRIRLFERTRPSTLEEAIAALATMREYTPHVPGGQVPWISVGGLASQITAASGDLPPILETGREAGGRWVANSLIFVGAGASTAIDGTAEFFDRTCAGVVLRLISIDGTIPAGATLRFDLAPTGATSFRIADLGDGARDLLIVPEQLEAARPCDARIVLAEEAGDRAGAKALFLQDQQTGGTP
jgi:hypothetical protein